LCFFWQQVWFLVEYVFDLIFALLEEKLLNRGVLSDVKNALSFAFLHILGFRHASLKIDKLAQVMNESFVIFGLDLLRLFLLFTFIHNLSFFFSQLWCITRFHRETESLPSHVALSSFLIPLFNENTIAPPVGSVFVGLVKSDGFTTGWTLRLFDEPRPKTAHVEHVTAGQLLAFRDVAQTDTTL
jgi:hypothetical protein